MDSYEGLTDQLFHKLEADRNRIHYAKNVRINVNLNMYKNARLSVSKITRFLAQDVA